MKWLKIWVTPEPSLANVIQTEMIDKYPELAGMSSHEIEHKILQLIEEKDSIDSVVDQLADMLSGMPSEQITAMVSNIMADHFGNEKVMTTLLEMEYDDNVMTIQQLIDLMCTIAGHYNILLQPIIQEHVLSRSVMVHSQDMLAVTQVCKKNQSSNLLVELLISDKLECHFMNAGNSAGDVYFEKA